MEKYKIIREVLYKNKWCRIVSKGTYYILESKSNKYNDQYFLTSAEAFKAIGINIFNISSLSA